MEDLQAERESLNPNEVEEIRNDVLGTGKSSFIETPEMVTQSREKLMEAIAKMAYVDKAAFLEAHKPCPEIYETESNPLFFLRRERFDPTVW